MAEQAKAQPKKTRFVWRGIIGFLIFLAGLVLALVGGIADPGSGSIALALVILGILVGFLNVTAREAIPLMIAAIALIVVGKAGFGALDEVADGLGSTINDIVANFAQLMAPAAVISAVRALLSFGFPGD